MKKSTKLKLLLLIPLVASAVFILAKGSDSQTKPIALHEELIYDKDLPFQEVIEPIEPQWQSYTVKEKDNFSLIGLHQFNLKQTEILKIATLSNTNFNISQLKVGQVLDYLMDSQGNLQAIKFNLKTNLEYLVTRQESGFTGKKIEKATTRVHQIYKGTISHSLNSDLKNQGVPINLATKAGQLLEKRNNLRRDLRTGDNFELLIASDEVDGRLFTPKIEAIRVNGHRIKTEIYLHSDGAYYDKGGKSLEPGFNRYPLEQSFRVSSGFNLHRKHPVTGEVRPHYGTDFATPVGTAVTAPAEGKVKRIGYQKYAGKYLVIEHFNGYLTRYFHLSKVLVKNGDKITMGEKIALTGNTGRTTGAHLHYEVHKNGQPVDAMLVKLPENRSLEGKELATFQANVLSKVALINKNHKTLAYSENSEQPTSDKKS